MKFTLANQDLESILPLAGRAKKILQRLKDGRLLTQEELAAMLSVHKSTGNLRMTNPEFREYALVVRTRKNTITVWGNKKTIAALRKRQNVEQQ